MQHSSTIKHLLICCAMAALSALPCRAAEPNSLCIFFADGTSTSIQLYTRPRVTFEGDGVCIRSSVAEFSYPASDVLKFHYRVNDITVGVDDAEATKEAFRQEGENITFDATIPASAIQLFAEDGKRVPVSLATTAGRPTLSITNLPAGVYMLSVNGRTSKFVKR